MCGLVVSPRDAEEAALAPVGPPRVHRDPVLALRLRLDAPAHGEHRVVGVLPRVQLRRRRARAALAAAAGLARLLEEGRVMSCMYVCIHYAATYIHS